MIADFYVVQKQNFKISAIISPERDDGYKYTGGVNIKAIVVYFISAGLAYYWSSVNPIAVGATIPTFVLAFALYILACKVIKNK